MSTTEKSTKSCTLCVEEDSEEMVCCDKCDGWYHFSCGGVTESIANVEWVCSSCTSLTNSVARAPPGNHSNLPAIVQVGEYIQSNPTSDVGVAKKDFIANNIF